MHETCSHLSPAGWYAASIASCTCCEYCIRSEVYRPVDSLKAIVCMGRQDSAMNKDGAANLQHCMMPCQESLSHTPYKTHMIHLSKLAATCQLLHCWP